MAWAVRIRDNVDSGAHRRALVLASLLELSPRSRGEQGAIDEARGVPLLGGHLMHGIGLGEFKELVRDNH